MNREQKRSMERQLRKKGASPESAKNTVEAAQNLDLIRFSETGKNTPPKEFREGGRVLLNIDAIKARKNYGRMTASYREFVEASDGVVFTAHVEHSNLISLQEDPRWLFWSGDLDPAPEAAE